MLDPIREAAQVLKRGGIIVYPTKTIYALGASIFYPAAVQKVAQRKDDSLVGPIPIMVNSFRLAENLAYIGEGERMILQDLWPGPTTVLLPRRADLLADLVQEGKVALRFSDDVGGKIIEETGFPLTALPAFDTNSLPITQPEEIDIPADFVVQGLCQYGRLSTIIDLTERKVIREGVELEKVKNIIRRYES